VTESDWWAVVDAEPGAPPWYVLANWLEERGDPRAAAAREACWKGLAPHPCQRVSDPGHTWDWYARSGRWGTKSAELPDDVFERLPGGECRYPGCKEYLTASEACRALLAALRERG
jgi:hypothetical protein